jgi:hypothetical protein
MFLSLLLVYLYLDFTQNVIVVGVIENDALRTGRLVAVNHGLQKWIRDIRKLLPRIKSLISLRGSFFDCRLALSKAIANSHESSFAQVAFSGHGAVNLIVAFT